MQICNGLAPQNSLNPNLRLNPMHYIIRVITTFNLRKDLEHGRTRDCSFSKFYLLNPFTYKKKYQIVERLGQASCFSSPGGKKHYIRALLHPCSYLENCSLFDEQTRDTCDHLLTSCPRGPDPRPKATPQTYTLQLLIYPLPTDQVKYH